MMSRRTVLQIAILAAGFAVFPARAALEVLACEPEWGALVKELAGERARVYNATTAMQDIHRIQARPSLIAAARRADLLVCTGAELEIGWLPLLLRESGNPRIRPNARGWFAASQYVSLIDAPTRVDRSEGDVHPQGNPHLHADPRNIAKVAAALAERLAELDAAGAADYARRAQDFATRWQGALARWQGTAAPLKGVRVIEHHHGFGYLFRWLGMEVVGYLEPKPGIEPSSRHLTELLEAHKARPAKFVVRASYVDARAAQWFADHAAIPVAVLPFSVGGTPAARDLFAWYDDLIARLLEAAR